MQATPGMTLVGRRYQLLNELGVGGMGKLYRAVDRLTGRTLALKRVATPDGHPSGLSSGLNGDSARLALAQEFRLLASLHHPNVINVLDYWFDESGQPFFTMELQEDAQTIVDAGRGQPQAVQVNLLVQLLQALAYVHRRGIIHRDLKPGNVLVKGGQVKVVDFGVSITRERPVETVAGTLAYMAPEVLRGEGATEASDLYAVGIIAYELLSGHKPYVAKDVHQLVTQILNTQPNLSGFGLTPAQESVLAQLLDKKPSARSATAELAMEALCQVWGQPQPQETPLIRESYLQAAKLVGRGAELAQLTSSLDNMLAVRGSSWLVGGESGVGKSRLLEELRAQALVKGALVLRGQAIREGGTPFQVWRDAVRWVALISDLSEFETEVLKGLIPDIGGLLDRQVSDAPQLEPEAALARLLTVVQDIFLRLKQPAVIILEDIHWAGSNSLTLLSRLNRVVERLPVLIVASYRDDERPEVSSLFPRMHEIHLRRLKSESIAELCEAMLGPAGRQPQVIALLRKETEGNPFFLVEVIRALAQEAGQLSLVGKKDLPLQVFTGGMQRIIANRLSKISAKSRALLYYAAAVGRQLDVDVLRAIAPDVVLDTWQTVCANAAVLEFQDGEWRFAHDKIRDALLNEVPEVKRPALHARIAGAIETVHPDSPDQAAVLAYHWHQAGDMPKEGNYAALAGAQSLKNGAYKEAITFLTRALEILGASGTPRQARSHLELLLGQAHNGQGQLKEARIHFGRALEIFGWPLPGSQAGLAAGLLGQVLVQVLHRIWPPRASRSSMARREARLEATRAYEHLLEIAHFANETLVSLYAGLRSLNLAEDAGPSSPELARTYASMCYAAGLVPLRSVAEDYRRRALRTANELKELPAMGWAVFVSGYYFTGLGWWDRSDKEITQALEIYRRLGDLRRHGETTAVRSYTAYFKGEFENGSNSYVGLYEAARKRDDTQQQAWALDGQAMHLLRMGKTDQALALLKVAEPLFETINDRVEELQHHGLLALGHLRRGELEQARIHADRTAQMISQSRPSAPYAIDGYSTVVEVYLSSWESASKPEERKEAMRLARKALGSLEAFARVFPVGRPRYWLWKGLAEWLSGNRSRAQRSWQQSVNLAARLQMPYEEALGHYEIGRHLTPSDQVRSQHLNRACDLFSGLSAAYDWAHAKLALEGTA
ncbi:MAG TPA: AAA family ATPase [Anaerolineales bacterium]|nr:AAA family ATPase [Anaerolineales bacterium]